MNETTNETRASIEATIRDYIEGWYEGDAARMDRALHDGLVKRVPSEGEGHGDLREVTKARMVDLTKEGGGGAPGADYEVVVHHVSGRIASARVHSQDYLDYLQLVETNEGWKIASVLFRTHD